MLRAKAIRPDGRTGMIFGLERGNIELLQQGHPISFDLDTIGLEGSVLILFGETQQDLLDQLESAGMIFGQGGVQ